MRIKEMAVVAALAVCIVPAFAQRSGGSAGQDGALAAKVKEAKDKAAEVTKALTDAAGKGQDTQSLQAMIDQLKAITDRLDKLEDEVAAMKKGGQSGGGAPSPLGKTVVGGFVQLQYRSSENPGEFDGFGARRVRVNMLNDNDRTHIKVSYDFAATQFGTFNEAPESGGQLRDAYVTYDTEPKVSKIIFGRQSVPLGYEIERGDTDREMPERTKYNDTFFNNQRSTGVQFRRMFGANVEAFAGMMNALTFSDPGQRAVSSPVGNRLAGVGGVRYKSKKLDAGVSAFFGKRQSIYGAVPGQVNPSNDRRFVYFDTRYNVANNLTLRAEAMVGHDRIPNQTFTAGDNPRDVNGGHVQLAYTVDPANTIAARYEQFDPNVHNSGDLFHGDGITWLHQMNTNLQLSAAFERFTDETRVAHRNWNVATIRVQYKF